MAQQKNPTVTAIVPAYNEAERIGAVLKVLLSYPGFDEVLVINDGSTDDTASVARTYGARVIDIYHNHGKGRAMDMGVSSSTGEMLFFCDADVRGLSHGMLNAVIEPVLLCKTEMFIAMRNRKVYYVRSILRVIPLLGGERALTRELWNKIPAEFKENFKIETALNYYASRTPKGFMYEVFPGLSQTIKEKKYGILPGFASRVRMYWQIISTNLSLHLRKPR